MDEHQLRHEQVLKQIDTLKEDIKDIEKRMKELEFFVKMSPSPQEHHDDHIAIKEARQRTSYFFDNIVKQGAKILLYAILIGTAVLLGSNPKIDSLLNH